ncbi:hypothetical protein BaRGS_00013230 [Batillaria attramentaria]|uniref:Secreted protein n=1 Tax=Batillaria attramentaria TaxID=370345 RepID=A0ABD0L857_9CAEN
MSTWVVLGQSLSVVMLVSGSLTSFPRVISKDFKGDISQLKPGRAADYYGRALTVSLSFYQLSGLPRLPARLTTPELRPKYAVMFASGMKTDILFVCITTHHHVHTAGCRVSSVRVKFSETAGNAVIIISGRSHTVDIVFTDWSE